MVQQYHCGSAERAPLADKSRGAGLCAEICLHVLVALRWGRGKPNSAHKTPFPARRQVWVGRSSRECIMCWVVSVLLRWIALRKDSTIRRILGLIQPCFRIYRYLSAVCPRLSPINPVEVRLPTPCSTRQALNLYDLDRTCQNHPVVVGVSVTPVVLLWRVEVDSRRNFCVPVFVRYGVSFPMVKLVWQKERANKVIRQDFSLFVPSVHCCTHTRESISPNTRVRSTQEKRERISERCVRIV